MGRRERVVIVGAGLGGVRTAESLRRAGWEGSVTLLSDEQEAPYDRPPLSKEILLGTRDPESIVLRDPATLAELEVDLRLGVRATGVDPGARVVVTDRGAVPFDHLVLATGSAARRLPALDGLDDVTTLRTLADALQIRDALDAGGHLVVVGAGFVGSEVASSARERGLGVTVLEMDAVPLARVLGPELGAAFARLHRAHGTDLRLQTTIARVDRDGSRIGRLHLTDGSTIEPALVVVGIGAAPETGWLASSGLELGNGVVCDAALRTGIPGIHAIGDLCSWENELFGRRQRVEHWTNAAEQAAHVARAIATGETTPFRGSNFVWSDQYGARIQFVGVSSPDVTLVEGSLDEETFVAWYREGDRLVGALAVNAPRHLMRSRKAIEAGAGFDEARATLEA